MLFLNRLQADALANHATNTSYLRELFWKRGGEMWGRHVDLIRRRMQQHSSLVCDSSINAAFSVNLRQVVGTISCRILSYTMLWPAKHVFIIPLSLLGEVLPTLPLHCKTATRGMVSQTDHFVLLH